jgi:hypothetical protein
LPKSRHLVVRGIGHGALPHGCVDDLVAEFVESASAETLDVACVARLRRPPFFVTFAGPRP